MNRRRLALLIILLVAFGMRVWQLPQLPPGLWYDEAYNGMDAMAMANTGHYMPFLVGNNGREAMVHYLLMLTITVLGNTPLAARSVGAVAGFLTIPLMYRFAYALLGSFTYNRHYRRWLAIAATAWLAVSWWHILLSRLGLRPVLLPPLLMLSLYFFWRGWAVSAKTSHGSRFALYVNFVLAGFWLGLSQYTYLSARLAPVVVTGLGLLLTLQTLIYKKFQNQEPQPTRRRLKSVWLGLLITAFVAMLVFTPLGLFFLNHPNAFSARTGDVVFIPRTGSELAGHLLQAVSLFFGASHELYRHHLPGRAMLGWLEIPFFWVGLLWLLHPSRLRRPTTLFILLGLGVMWLPALLASPPVHALRPVGLLPFYYLIVTLGLSQVSRITYHALCITHHVSRLTYHVSRQPQFLLPLALAVFIPLNGLINGYDYFNRWANHPEVYQEYNGPLVDVTRYVLDTTQTRDIIMPFHLYIHPTTRYLLGQTFPEQTSPPPPATRPVEMLLIPNTFQLLYVGNIPDSPAMVLLTRNAAGQGAAYVSRPPRAEEQTAITAALTAAQAQLKPFKDKLGRTIVQFLPLSSEFASVLAPLFTPTPLRVTQVNWANLAELRGYEVTPNPVKPGQPLTLNLYWRSLTDNSFDYRLFAQLIDVAGNPLNQWEGDAFREDMYRWRPAGLLPTQHTLWVGPNTPSGPYLVRLGFFDEESGQRLPLRADNNSGASANQVQLGLFYVSADDRDPRQPAAPLAVNFADVVQLIGVTTPITAPQPPTLPVTLHWQTLTPTAKPYTVFLQLLNEQGEVVSGRDRQPFDGLYPTNLWSPGEVIAATFPLPLPEKGLAPGKYRLITGFYDFDTGQRLPVTGGGDFAQVAEFEVR